MTRATGSADLPLHGGRVPPWLAQRMAALGRIVAEAICGHYGREEFLRRLSNPFWFQSFGAVMGMDWHSSGITTSVLSALKRGLAPVAAELGLYVCGGRGRHSRATPRELAALGERTGLDGAALAGTSRLVAKVDNAAVQDGYQLYLHGMVVAADGHWAVVQQGMAPALGYARRYHWLSFGLESFVEAPHAAVEGIPRRRILNLTDALAGAARGAQVALVDDGPARVVRELEALRRSRGPRLSLPAHHDVRAADMRLDRLHAALAAAAEAGPRDFAELLAVPGVGPRTVEALALVAEVLFGTPARFADPARFSYAHGGKDGHPFAVPLDVYDETIRVLKDAVDGARLGRQERLAALARLDRQARWLEGAASGPDFAALMVEQRAAVTRLGAAVVGAAAAAGSARALLSAAASERVVSCARH